MKKLFTPLLVLIVLFSFSIPQIKAATTHHYTCADFVGFNANASCSSSVITFPSITKGSFFDDGTHFNLFGITNWFISFTVAGTGTGNYLCSSGSCSTVYHWTATETDVPFTNNSGVNPEGIYFENGASSGNAGNFVGTIGNICITDTIGGCGSITPASFNLWQFFDF